MTSTKSTYDSKALLALVLVALVACNGDDHCDFFAVDESVRLERNTPTEVPLSVGDLPSDLHYVPTLTVRAYGRSEGLSHWIVARDGNQGRHCTAEPRDADHGCSRPVDVTSHSTVGIWLEGAVAGQYTIELALWDYRGEETLFEDPVCTKEIVVDVK